MRLQDFVTASWGTIALAFGPGLVLASSPAGGGTLTFTGENKSSITFNYSTSEANDKNWIGLFDPDFGPEHGSISQMSSFWAYAKGGEGTVTIASPLANQFGRSYTAHFLADDSFNQSLAEPAAFTYLGSQGPQFLVESFTTHNGRQGQAFNATISGLFAHSLDETPKFSKVSGAKWISVSSSGLLTGKPTSSGDAKVVVEAMAADGSKGRLSVTIPIRPAKSDLVPQLNVITFNIFQSALNFKDAHRKQIAFLTKVNADIVGMQESFRSDAKRLADTLGWYYRQDNDPSIISRYPIVGKAEIVDGALSARIALDGNKSEIVMWNAHLAYEDYGPYGFAFLNQTADQVFAAPEDLHRTRQITEIVKRINASLGDEPDVPVLLTGGFNAPSHLDWTAATSKKHYNAGEVRWPTSVIPFNAGLVDSFREYQKDPAANPNNTWSPIQLYGTGGTDDPLGEPEPMDRVDFIYHKGLELVSSGAVSDKAIVGSPKPYSKDDKDTSYQDNMWPSDHWAVKTTFKVPSKA